MEIVRVFPESISSEQVTRLGGVDYRIRLDWFVKMSRWVATISLKNGTRLATGVGLDNGKDLLAKADALLAPRDRLLVLCASTARIQQLDLGNTVDIVMMDEPLPYVPAPLEEPVVGY